MSMVTAKNKSPESVCFSDRHQLWYRMLIIYAVVNVLNSKSHEFRFYTTKLWRIDFYVHLG